MTKFEYKSAHLKVLKKFGTAKIMFLLLGCLTLLLQSIAWLVVWYNDKPISTSDMVFVAITIIAALLFICTQFFYYRRNSKIMAAVKQYGSIDVPRSKARYSDKGSWAGGLVVLYRVFAVLFVILLGILVVSFIQNYLNWGKVILKMPFMVYCAVGFLNSSADFRFNIESEKISDNMK